MSHGVDGALEMLVSSLFQVMPIQPHLAQSLPGCLVQVAFRRLQSEEKWQELAILD